MTHPLLLAPARLMSSVENEWRADVTKLCTVDGKLKRKPIIPPSFTKPKVSIVYDAQNANVEEEHIETLAFAHSRKATFTHVDAFRIKDAIVESSSKFQSETRVTNHLAVGVHNASALASPSSNRGRDVGYERLTVLRCWLDLNVKAENFQWCDFRRAIDADRLETGGTPGGNDLTLLSQRLTGKTRRYRRE